MAKRAKSKSIPSPPFDCRLTRDCLHNDLRLGLPLTATFADLRSEHTLVDVFFERCENSSTGGPGASRLAGRSRPVYLMRYGRWVGATCFDESIPEMGIVWLVAALALDDPDDIGPAESDLAMRRRQGRLFPQEIDYLRVQLDLRRADTKDFAEEARRDARALMQTAERDFTAEGYVARVPVKLMWEVDDALLALHIAVAEAAQLGPRSHEELPLSAERFLLTVGAVRQAAESMFGRASFADAIYEWPSGLQDLEAQHRGYLLVFERPAR
jgi:hypothetical protein